VSILEGASVARGPMAGNHFTLLHNRVYRGCGIHTRYVGVFGYIAGQTDGWKLTEKKIAADLGVGRDFVRAALLNFEAARCLIRDRLRKPDGTLGAAVWFITDLPAQLQQAGITDPELIDRSVRDAYDQWRSARSAPVSENPTQAAPEPGTEPDEPETPRSEPMSEKPMLAEPMLAEPTHKKNNNKNTNLKNTKPGGPPPEPPAAAAAASAPKPTRTRRHRAPSKPLSRGDHQRRARERVGPPALEAITANPDIALADLRALISHNDPNLTPAQVAGRAATLAASWPGRSVGLNESGASVPTEVTNLFTNPVGGADSGYEQGSGSARAG
jgi:hypothetical protein